MIKSELLLAEVKQFLIEQETFKVVLEEEGDLEGARSNCLIPPSHVLGDDLGKVIGVDLEFEPLQQLGLSLEQSVLGDFAIPSHTDCIEDLDLVHFRSDNQHTERNL